MTQIPSHSQTPEFGTNKSQTTAILYQRPPSKAEIIKSHRIAKAKAWMQDTLAVVVILGTIGSVPFMVRNCSDDMDHQQAQAVKHQLQFSANGGTR